MSHQCPNCHNTLHHDAKFCTRCGAAVSSASDARRESNPTAETVVETDALAGRVLDGKYKLLARLGAGGMGAVYRARRLHIGDEVAVKLLHAQFVSDETMVERFRREARAAATLHHPNIVGIYDFGEAAGEGAPAYIVMELVAGESLGEMIRKSGALEAGRALALTREICAGVGAAHRHHIVHRDLKPDNIIVNQAQWEDERDSVKVVDFGIARLRDAASSNVLTQTGVVIGTPYYMSPEQCRGEHAESPADVYSLGAILYEMLAGAPPFVAATPTGVIAKHLTEPPPPLPAALGLPPALEAVIMRALAKEPSARQPDANTLARELNAALAAAPAVSPVVPAPQSDAAHAPTPERSEAAPAQMAADNIDERPQRPRHTTPPQHVLTATTDAPPPERTPSQPAHEVTPSSGRRLVFVLAALLLTLVVGVAVGAWMSGRGGGEGGGNRTASDVGAPGAIPPPASNAAARQGTAPLAADAPGAKADDKTYGGGARPAQTAPASPSVSNQPPAASQPPVSSQPSSTNVVAPAAGPPGNFFVIVGSFRKTDERGKAEARLTFLRARGYDARVIDSDDYPKLAGGLLVVVLGPYAKGYAVRLAAELRAVAPEGAYVKAGR